MRSPPSEREPHSCDRFGSVCDVAPHVLTRPRIALPVEAALFVLSTDFRRSIREDGGASLARGPIRRAGCAIGSAGGMLGVTRGKLGLRKQIKQAIISSETDFHSAHILGMSDKRVCILREVSVTLCHRFDSEDNYVRFLGSIGHQPPERTGCVPCSKRRRLSG